MDDDRKVLLVGMVVVFLCLLAVAGAWCLFFAWYFGFFDRSEVNLSFSKNSQRKVPHATKKSAENAIARLRRRGKPGSESLTPTFNPERNCWYVEKSKDS